MTHCKTPTPPRCILCGLFVSLRGETKTDYTPETAFTAGRIEFLCAKCQRRKVAERDARMKASTWVVVTQ